MAAQPITIHQFHAEARAGHAVTNHMRFVRHALAQAGIGGEIFVDRNLAPQSYRILKFMPARIWDCDLLLIHHSGAIPGLGKVLSIEVPKALVYHNVTPESFFAHDPKLAVAARLGRQQLNEIAPHVHAAFGVSRYNCAELALAGLKETQVFPLLDLSAPLPGSHPLPEALRPAENTRTLLFVGRLAPHKNQSVLIETLFHLRDRKHTYKLVLVGSEDPVYTKYLKLLTRALGVERHVVFAGVIPQTKLEEFYHTADALVCPSLHEGFCLPLIEAMQRDLPVFALPTTGTRDTLGKAGLRLLSREPHRIAETVDAALDHEALIEALVLGQRQRVGELAQVHNSARVAQLCVPLVHRLRGTVRPTPLPEVYT